MVVAMAGFATEEERWDAVVRRDGAADGAFYYSVRTTGVYCRPSCASRPARRENVDFHLTCADAERAGFRPCKRCRPNEAGIAEQHAAAVAKACRLIEGADDAPDLDALAAAAGMSRFHFHRVFRSVTGVTPKAYADARRSERVREELSRSRTVTDAIYGAGFNSSGRFYEKSAEILGMTPTDFRARRAACRDPLRDGRLLAGDGAGGGDREGRVRHPAGRRRRGAGPRSRGAFSASHPDRRRPRVRAHRGAGGELCGSAAARGLNLPLDVRGTAFQQRVWQALRAIPAGARASYREIAERIGAPKAVRAVAQACAANSAGGGDSVPSCGAERWRAVRLSLGRGT